MNVSLPDRCTVWVVAPCCGCDWIEHTAVEGDHELPEEGELAVCREDCDGNEPHRFGAGVTCDRQDRPPLAPAWTHEQWTGHAFASGYEAAL